VKPTSGPPTDELLRHGGGSQDDYIPGDLFLLAMFGQKALSFLTPIINQYQRDAFLKALDMGFPTRYIQF
jgi:hypothetical protein